MYHNKLSHDNYFLKNKTGKNLTDNMKMLNSSAGTEKGVLKVYQQIKVHNDRTVMCYNFTFKSTFTY